MSKKKQSPVGIRMTYSKQTKSELRLQTAVQVERWLAYDDKALQPKEIDHAAERAATLLRNRAWVIIEALKEAAKK